MQVSVVFKVMTLTVTKYVTGFQSQVKDKNMAVGVPRMTNTMYLINHINSKHVRQ